MKREYYSDSITNFLNIESEKILGALEAWINCVIVFTNGFVTVRNKIKGVSVINAKYFSTYFERLPDNKTASLLWEEREKLRGLAG